MHTCQVSESDLVAAMWTHLRPRPPMRVLGLLLSVLVVVVFVSSALAARSRPGFVPFWVMVASLVYLGFMFFFWYPYRTRRLFRQSKAASAPFDLEFDGGGIKLSSAHGNAQLPWENIRKWKEGSEVLLLYHNDALYHPIPKRCFSAEELSQLCVLLRKHVRRVA